MTSDSAPHPHRDAAATGLVLAAGAGSRYGMPKILVPGWLEHSTTALRAGGCHRVLVVTGAARPPMPPEAEEIHCPRWQRGIGASLRAGLEASGGADRVLIHLVDCPDIGAPVISRVLSRATAPLARAGYRGRPGHPVLVAPEQVAPLLATLGDDDGAGPYLARHRAEWIECGDLASGRDVDHRPQPRR